MGRPVVHFEIEGRDQPKLSGFYTDMFGWSVDEADYGLVQGAGLGGAVCTVPETPSTTWRGPTRADGYTGHVMIYVGVTDVEAALARAEELGGVRMQGPDTVADGTVMGKFRDPDGHLIGVVRAGGQLPDRVPALDGFERFAGTWDIEATHPGLPGADIRGEMTFEWFDGRRFLVQRTHYDHAQMPDATAFIGVTGGRLSMHYFDVRGVYRRFEVGLDGNRWWFSGDAGDFYQRFSGSLSEDASTITGMCQMSYDGSTWTDDLAPTYRKR